MTQQCIKPDVPPITTDWVVWNFIEVALEVVFIASKIFIVLFCKLNERTNRITKVTKVTNLHNFVYNLNDTVSPDYCNLRRPSCFGTKAKWVDKKERRKCRRPYLCQHLCKNFGKPIWYFWLWRFKLVKTFR